MTGLYLDDNSHWEEKGGSLSAKGPKAFAYSHISGLLSSSLIESMLPTVFSSRLSNSFPEEKPLIYSWQLLVYPHQHDEGLVIWTIKGNRHTKDTFSIILFDQKPHVKTHWRQKHIISVLGNKLLLLLESGRSNCLHYKWLKVHGKV